MEEKILQLHLNEDQFMEKLEYFKKIILLRNPKNAGTPYSTNLKELDLLIDKQYEKNTTIPLNELAHCLKAIEENYIRMKERAALLEATVVKQNSAIETLKKKFDELKAKSSTTVGILKAALNSKDKENEKLKEDLKLTSDVYSFH